MNPTVAINEPFIGQVFQACLYLTNDAAEMTLKQASRELARRAGTKAKLALTTQN